MKKYLPLVILSLLVYACSNNPLNNSDKMDEVQTAERSGDDGSKFREATWGMSKKEVMQSEEGEPVFNSDYRVDYITQTMGMVSRIGYTFNNNDELIRASVFILTSPEDKNQYIESYKKIQEELKKKYGKTIIDTVQYRDPTQKIDPDIQGEAVCNGQLLYATQWDLPESNVQLLLRGEKSECKITVVYVSEEGIRKMMKERGIEDKRAN